MKNFKFVYLLFLIFILDSCQKDLTFDSLNQFPNEANSFQYENPHLKIAVVSDIHYMDPSLLPTDAAGAEAFQNYLAQDPKLLEFSDPILRKVISDLIVEKPDIVLIPGDLTKDGEKVSHETFAAFLKQLSDKNIKVFVVPGNHDIMNPYAVSFTGAGGMTPVESIESDDFASIYADFGYKDALRDGNSLSYINKITDKLWILGIDACRYAENTTEPIVGGVIKSSTMNWIKERMAEARNKNITVLTMMHHGIMEHYAGQNLLDPGYVVDNWEQSAASLMDAGIKFIFTGHYHANDITSLTINRNTLYDIETGSLVSWPSPYRIITIYGNFIDVYSKQVTTIDAAFPGGIDFTTYSQVFHTSHFDGYFYYALQLKYGVSPADATYLAPLFRNAIMAHYAGDENLVSPDKDIIKGLETIAPPLAGALYSLWTDLLPKDNKAIIKIK